jgi:hypothetical protein
MCIAELLITGHRGNLWTAAGGCGGLPEFCCLGDGVLTPTERRICL